MPKRVKIQPGKTALPVKRVDEMAVDHEKAGENVKNLRTKCGLKMIALANHFGISSPYMSDLEHGKRQWTEDRYNAAMKFLNDYYAKNCK